MNDSLRHMSCYKAPCNLTQHCWLTTPNIVGCYMLRPFPHPVTCCWVLLVKVLSQQLPTFLLFRDRRSVAQQCWIRLPQLFQHCWSYAQVLHIVCKVLWVVSFPRCTASPNIDGSCCSHLHTILVPRARRFLATWSGSLQIKPSGSGDENVCTQLPTWTQQLPTLLV